MDHPKTRDDHPPIVRFCLHCKQLVTLIYDASRGYHRGACACGAQCTTGTAGWRS